MGEWVEKEGRLLWVTESAMGESEQREVLEVIMDQQILLDELNETGESGTAVVTDLTVTQIEINEEGVMIVIQMDVTPDDGSVGFPAEMPVAVAKVRISNYEIGKKIFVRFDSQNHQRISIDFDAQGGTVSRSDTESMEW